MADSSSTTSPHLNPAPGAPEQSSTQIDSRRAQQLLERALAVAERGDVPAAILSCRQAIALNPTAPQGYSMLGLLLERSGDSQGAISSYEKVLQMDPGSLLERESLSRLRAAAATRRTTRNVFSFDENELFDERHEDLPTTDDPDAAARAVIFEGAPDTDTDAAVLRAAEEHIVSPTEFAFSGSDTSDIQTPPAASSAAPSTPAPPSAAAAIGARPSTPAASATSLNAVNASAANAQRAASVAPPMFPSSATTPKPPQRSGPPSGFVMPAYEPPDTQSKLQKLMARPNFYFRGVPLAATALVSLGFLLWAHNQASSRDATMSPGVTGTPTTTVVNDEPPSVRPVGMRPPNARGANRNPNSDAIPINPGGQAPAGPSNPGGGGVATPVNPAANPSAPVPANPSTRPAPVTPGTTDAPGSTSAAPTTTTPQTSDSPAPAPAPSSATAGNDGAGASTGGAPVGANGSPNRDYTRVAPSTRPAPPIRASAGAARDERASAGGNATGTGANSGAITSATRAIDAGGGDTAFRYQQRAALYLEAGETSRAINDYQSAIAVYNDMISRNDRVGLARSGIQTCQRGIQIAQTRAAR